MKDISIAVQALRRLGFVLAGAWSPLVCAVVLNGTAPPATQLLEAISASTVLLSGGAGGICTATVIGKRALLTAANCVSINTAVSAKFGGRMYSLRCEPIFGQGQRSFNVALCVSDQQFESVRPARIETSRSVTLGESLTLAGYGCREAGGLDRSGIGRLSVGSALVTTTGQHLQGAPLQLPFVVVRGAASCFGDAGGGVYRALEEPSVLPVIVGLMSHGDLATTSFIVPLAAAGLADAIRKAGDEKGATICGLHDIGPSCGPGIVMRPAQMADMRLQLSFPGIDATSQAGFVKGQIVRAAGTGEESMAQAFRRVCGAALESIPGITNARLQAAETLKSKTGTPLELPLCPPRVAIARDTKTIQEGDSVWSIWKGLSAPTPTAAVASAGKKEFDDYVKEFKQANPGVKLKPNVVVKVPPIAGKAVLANVPVVAMTAPPQAIPILSLSLAQAQKDCKVGLGLPVPPYDLPLLLEILALNRQEDSVTPTSVIILVADSGLQGAGEGIFSNSVLINRMREDREEFHKSIVPLVLEPNAFKHGTAVASVALGGPIFSRMGVLQGEPRIRLAMQRIYYTPDGSAGNLDGVTADVSRFDNLISLAEEQNASVVNLSLRSTVPIPPLKVNLDDVKGRILFVAAAGNQHKKLSFYPTADTEAVYPALYGGSGNNRVITVMAHLNGERPSFSNWGAQYVDIAAPGCDIPTLEWDLGIGRFVDSTASGTSLAAPLVTFAAAIVQSESGGRLIARDLKRRLLVSADLSPLGDLSKDVEDGRKLNVAKAAALKVDIFEPMNGAVLAGQINFIEDKATLANDSMLQFKCKEDEDLRVQRRDLFKIARWIPEKGRPMYVVYFRTSEGLKLFSRDVCEAPQGVRLELRKPDGVIQNIKWDELKDLVMRF